MDQLAPSVRLRLENHVAVVTGGARGIGAGIVRRFVAEGARVVFSDLLNEKGKGLEEELGKEVAFCRADAASPPDTEALMNFAMERFGRLDCVVNNAGAAGEGGPIAGTSIEVLIDPLRFCSAAPSWESSMLSRTWSAEPS
jgi:NAD(P)-dependent dehydrogenase (short-subunit alcohol dehydrogenase family)